MARRRNAWLKICVCCSHMHCEWVIFLKYHVHHTAVCMILIICRVVLVKEIKTPRTLLYKLPHLFSFGLFSLGLSNLIYFILWLEAGSKWPCCWVPWGFGVFCQQHEVCLFSIDAGRCLSLRHQPFLMHPGFYSIGHDYWAPQKTQIQEQLPTKSDRSNGSPWMSDVRVPLLPLTFQASSIKNDW